MGGRGARFERGTAIPGSLPSRRVAGVHLGEFDACSRADCAAMLQHPACGQLSPSQQQSRKYLRNTLLSY